MFRPKFTYGFLNVPTEIAVDIANFGWAKKNVCTGSTQLCFLILYFSLQFVEHEFTFAIVTNGFWASELWFLFSYILEVIRVIQLQSVDEWL